MPAGIIFDCIRDDFVSRCVSLAAVVRQFSPNSLLLFSKANHLTMKLRDAAAAPMDDGTSDPFLCLVVSSLFRREVSSLHRER